MPSFRSGHHCNDDLWTTVMQYSLMNIRVFCLICSFSNCLMIVHQLTYNLESIYFCKSILLWEPAVRFLQLLDYQSCLLKQRKHKVKVENFRFHWFQLVPCLHLDMSYHRLIMLAFQRGKNKKRKIILSTRIIIMEGNADQWVHETRALCACKWALEKL
jgi:hypothetical protein